MPRDSSVCITTGYGLDGPGIESRWWRHFPHPSNTALGPTQPPKQISYQEVKRPGCVVNHPFPSRAKLKERVELYLLIERYGSTVTYKSDAPEKHNDVDEGNITVVNHRANALIVCAQKVILQPDCIWLHFGFINGTLVSCYS